MKQVLGNLVAKFGELTKDNTTTNGVSRGKSSSDIALRAMMTHISGLPTGVVGGVQIVLTNITDYLKFAEQEQTNRTEITARRDVALASIQAQRDAFSELMKYTFQERSAVLAKQFEVLDFALASGNIEVVQSSLNAMVTVIQTSPFKSMQEMQTALGSKDFVVRLE